MSVCQQNNDEFQALKSVVDGLRIELDLMKAWTGAGGEGYLKTMTLGMAPPEWSRPDRLIWKFDVEAVSSLTRSPYLYRLRDIVGPFARLNFSVSRLFQLYDEYRSFVNSDPGLFLSSGVPESHKNAILQFNMTIHVKLIGGADSDDPDCLYRSYGAATSALNSFDTELKRKFLPKWFWVGHLVSVACFASGILLLWTVLIYAL